MLNSSLKIFPIIFILMFTTCSSQISESEFDKNIIINDLTCWLNLMPGGPGSFHFAGEFTLTGKLIELPIELKKITVHNSNNVIYSIVPEIRNKFADNSELKDSLKSVFQFFTNPGLKLNSIIESVGQVDMKFDFSLNEKIFTKEINDIEVTRAY